MSDLNASTSHTSREQMDYELARLRIQTSSQYIGRMIWLITLIAGVLALIIVLAVVTLSLMRMLGTSGDTMLMTQPIPDVLTNWGGVILGFYFGQFVNLVKEFMGDGGTFSIPVISASSHHRPDGYRAPGYQSALTTQHRRDTVRRG